MVAARLGFEKAMVGTRRATPRSDCMDRLRKHHSHLAEGWFLARKAAWSLSGCMATDSADYYMLVNEWVWSKSRDCLLRLEVVSSPDPTSANHIAEKTICSATPEMADLHDSIT